MQKIITLLFLPLFFSTTLFAQQSFQIEYGVSQGTQKAADSWSLSWYRNDTPKSGHVLRVNYDNSLMSDRNEIKSKSLQMDVANRWYNSLDKKLRLYLESGISGMAISSGNKWNQYYGEDCIYCFTFDPISNSIGWGDLFTEENSLLLYEFNDRQYAFNIMPGLTVGGGIDVDLGKSFYMGIHYKVNAYYWLGEHEILYYLRYGLNAGWKF